MKRLLFALLVAASVVLLVAPLSAKGMMFGIKGGLSEAKFNGSDVGDNSYKAGFVGGAFMNYELTDIFSIQPEVLFAMKGAKFDSAGVSFKDKLNYIEVPILLKANLPVSGSIKPSIYAGPAFDFRLSAKASDGEEIDFKDQTAGFDLGIAAGAMVAYQTETASIFVEGRYEVGLLTIAKNEDDTGSKPDITNGNFQIMVGFGVPF
jgi:hypothetical protein